MATTSQIRNSLMGVVTTVGKTKRGTYIVRKGFFYKTEKTSEDLANRVKDLLVANHINIQLVDHGEIWRPFNGGASVSNQSHWWVEFTIPQV